MYMKNTLKRTLALLLAFVMIFTGIPVILSFADNVTTVITNATQLDEVRNNLSGNYILGCNIDLASFGNWEPIGNDSNPFTGTFDGNGYTVFGVKVYCAQANSIGFFGYVSGGTIKNLHISGNIMADVGDYSGDYVFVNVGGIAGYVNKTVVKQCSFEGAIRCSVGNYCFSRASGIALAISSSLTDCYVNADIYAFSKAVNVMSAGISAWSDSTTIDKCYFKGSVVGESNRGYCYVGGINASGGGTISNCVVNSNNITGTTNDAKTYVNTIGNFGSYSNNINSDVSQSECESLGWHFNTVWTSNPSIQLQKRDIVSGVFNSYHLFADLDDDSNSYYVANIGGKNYKLSDSVVASSAEAECYKGRNVTAYLSNNEIIAIKINDEENATKKEWYDTSSSVENYGVKSYNPTKVSDVMEAATAFYSAMQDYISTLGSEAGDTDAVDKKGLIKELKNNNVAYFSLQADAPSGAIDAAYDAIAQFIIDIANQNQLYLEVNPKKSATEQALSLVNSIDKAIFSTSYSHSYGKYNIKINYTLVGQAFAGDITVTKKTGADSSYTGLLASSKERTREMIVAYVDNLSNIVKDQCKYALASIYNEFMDLTGLGELEESALKNYFGDKVDILMKKGYGNVLTMFQGMRTGYNAIKKFKAFATSTEKAEKFLSSYDNAQWMYNQLKSLDFSKSGVKKRAVKKAISLVDSAKKDLADKLYNYLYSVDTGDPENYTAWEKIKSWFSNGLKKLTMQCPVEFEIYDSEGNLLAYVDSSDNHDEYIYMSDNIYVEVDGDVKYVYYPADMEIYIKLIATDDGMMNYSVEQFENGVATGKINIFDVPLTEGETYEQTIPANFDIADNADALSLTSTEYTLTGSYYSADDTEAHVNVECLNSLGGFVIGDGQYPIGESVKMIAFADSENTEFKGWYVDGSLVSEDEIYRFTARDDTKIVALFGEKHEHTYVSDVTETPNCTDYGEIQYTCECGDFYIEILQPTTEHSWGEWTVATPATCTTEGTEQRICLNDSTHIETRQINATGHLDKNGDGACDTCGKEVSKNCTHICHKTKGISKFFWKIINFFNKLFKIKQYCSCGAKHW